MRYEHVIWDFNGTLMDDARMCREVMNGMLEDRSLPQAERELVVLRYFDGFSQAHIAEVLGISPQAVNGRLVRAKRRIAKYLKRNGLTGDDHETS